MTYKTYQEYLRHPKYRSVRAQAWARSSGNCEWCGAKATEVHHLRYPKWGTFDVPENLAVLCNVCHCKVHNKAN